MLIRAIIIAISFLLFCETKCVAQKFLVMDVKKANGVKRLRYGVGDQFKFRPKGSKKRYKAEILAFNDSIISFKKDTGIMLSDIDVIYRDRSNFVTHGLSRFCLIMGAGFVTLDSFNNAINNETPIVKKQALLESASFLAAGFILKIMMRKRYKVGKRCSLKIIDLSP